MDPILIEQVLINLLENSAKYSEPDSPIDSDFRKPLQRYREDTIKWLSAYDDGAPTSPGIWPD